MPRRPAYAKAFEGRWRIAETDLWGDDVLDLTEPAHITFDKQSGGELAFAAVKAWLDVRYGTRDGQACAEFTFEGTDDNNATSGRGWAMLGTAGRLVGHIFIHMGDDSGFVAERA